MNEFQNETEVMSDLSPLGTAYCDRVLAGSIPEPGHLVRGVRSLRTAFYPHELGLASSGAKDITLLTGLAYFLVTVGGVVLLSLVAHVPGKVIWPTVGIFAGFGGGLALIYEARITKGDTLVKACIYAAGFLLLFEVVEFINGLLAHVKTG